MTVAHSTGYLLILPKKLYEILENIGLLNNINKNPYHTKTRRLFNRKVNSVVR